MRPAAHDFGDSEAEDSSPERLGPRRGRLIDVTAILPCRNEIDHLDSCLESVFAQELQGLVLEVIVVDGMSDDGTRERLGVWLEREARLRVLDNQLKIMPTGMNIAIREAESQFVVVMGMHCRYPPTFIVDSVRALEESGADVSGGRLVTKSVGAGHGAEIVKAISTHAFGVGGAGFRVGALAGPADTVPYGCYRSSVLAKVGLFDERLIRNQDYELNARIRAYGGTLWMDPAITAEYYNQASYRGLLRQARTTGRWNAFMWYLAPYSFRGRHAVPALFLGFLVVGGIASWILPRLFPAFIGVLALYFALALAGSIQQAARFRSALLGLTLPFGFLGYHLAYGFGTLQGFWQLVSGRHPFGRQSRPWDGAATFRLRPRRPG